MALYLLDRNIVIDIKKYNGGSSVKNINIAREIDKRKHKVSPILSILEGKRGEFQSSVQMHDLIQEESAALEKFFKFAKLDDYLLNNKEETALLLPKFIEEKVSNKIPFIMACQILLKDLVGKEKVKIFLEKVLNLAKKYYVSVGEPYLLCAIAIVYGNQDAYKVLVKTEKDKSPEQNAYNAALDLRKIVDINLIFQNYKDGHCQETIKFLTRDKSLLNFMKFMRMHISSIIHYQSLDLFEHDYRLDSDRFFNSLPWLKDNEIIVESKKQYLIEQLQQYKLDSKIRVALH